MTKIAVVYSGISYQHQIINSERFRGRFDLIDIYRLAETDLSSYDALIMPRSTDQLAMTDCRRQIEAFLNLPGIVVTLGDYWGDWLPGCQYGGFTPEDDMTLVKTQDHPILNGIESSDLHWHKGINGLCSHGHFDAPEGAQVLVKNQRGDAILYEDRQSTKGIIVAGSQFDVFCHSFSKDEGAIRALENILDWIEAAAPGIRVQRSGKKIGVLFSGLHFHHHLFTRPEYQEDVELVYMRCLENTDLLKYNVLIVPRESNQEALWRSRKQIEQFLNQGRTLVSFGETVLPWLPGLVWENRRPKVCYAPDANEKYSKGQVTTDNLAIEAPDHPLFDGITLEDMRWHYHGIFHAQAGQQILLSDGQGGAVILFDKTKFPGKVLAMTLDPEEHAGFGEVTITEKFLDRCMDWVKNESRRIDR